MSLYYELSAALGVSCDYLLLGKRSAGDVSALLEPARALSERQIRCLEEVIKSFASACAEEDPGG